MLKFLCPDCEGESKKHYECLTCDGQHIVGLQLMLRRLGIFNPRWMRQQYRSYLDNWEYYAMQGRAPKQMTYWEHWRFMARWYREYGKAAYHGDWGAMYNLEYLACA